MPFVRAVIERSPAVKKLDLNRPDDPGSKSTGGDVARIPLKESTVPYVPARSALDTRLADVERLLHKIATVVVKQPGSTVLHDRLRNQASFLRKLKRQSLTARPPPTPSKPLPLTVRQTKKQRKARQRQLRALAEPVFDDPDLLGDLRFIYDHDDGEQASNSRRAGNRRDTVPPDFRDLRRLVFGEDADTAAVTRRPEPPPRTSRRRRRDQSPPPEPMTTRSRRGRPRRAAAPRADAFVTTRLPQTSRKKTR